MKIKLQSQSACFSAAHTPMWVCVCMIAEVAAGSMMDEGAKDIHIAACERINPLPTKETQLWASTTNSIPHTATILAH